MPSWPNDGFQAMENVDGERNTGSMPTESVLRATQGDPSAGAFLLTRQQPRLIGWPCHTTSVTLFTRRWCGTATRSQSAVRAKVMDVLYNRIA